MPARNEWCPYCDTLIGVDDQGHYYSHSDLVTHGLCPGSTRQTVAPMGDTTGAWNVSGAKS